MSEATFITEPELKLLERQFPALPKEIIISVAEAYGYELHQTTAHLFSMAGSSESDARKPGPVESDGVRIVRLIRDGWKVIVLMRGLPGSGKTVTAHRVFQASDIGLPPAKFILSTDDFFRRNGRYSYDVKQLQQAHTWNQERCYKAMARGASPIIIDNTNLAQWEMHAYCLMAVEFGYIVEVLEPATKWARDPKLLAEKNKHRVQKDKIVRMLNKFEMGITSDSLLRGFGLRYTQNVPQKRLFPSFIGGLYPSLVDPRHASIENSAFLPGSKFVQSNSYDLSFGHDAPKKETPIIEYVHNFNDNEGNEDIKKEEAKEDNIEVKRESAQAEATPSAPKAAANEPMVNLIDWLDNAENEGATAPSRNTTLAHYGAFPLMPMLAPAKSDSDSDIQSKKMKSNDPDLTAWGTNQQALQSWETVVRVKSPPSGMSMDFEIFKKLDEASNRAKTQLSDKTTNTNSDDFKFAQNCPEVNGRSILKARSRLINEGGVVIKNFTPRRKITVDMGCMTEEIANSEVKDYVKQLVDVFPSIPLEYMLDVYEKCQKDLNWTMDLLSETDYVSSFTVNETNVMEQENKVDEVPKINTWEFLKGKGSDDIKDESENHKQSNAFEFLEGKTDIKEGLKKHKQSNTWEFLEFKKSADIRDELEKRKESNTFELLEGKKSDDLEKSQQNKEFLESKQPGNITIESKKCKQQEEILNLKRQLEETVNFGKEHYSEFIWGLKNQRQGASKLGHDSSTETEPQDINYSSDSYEDEDGDPNDIIQVSLGEQLVNQLEKILGNEDYVNKKFHTTVQLPVSLAKQIHALYLQSVCDQIEEQNELINKDEELAQKIDNEQREASKGPNLNAIMDEQLAQFYQKKDMEQYESMSPDTLAMILKKKKLHKAFPSFAPNLIDNLLQAHSYEHVVDTLMASVNDKFIEPVPNLREAPITDEIIKDMKANKAIAEQVSKDDEDRDAQEFRDEATFYTEKAQQLQNSAQTYHRKGLGEVAVFYSKLAADMRTKRDFANQKATYLHLYQNTLKLRGSDTLDLHYLTVREAITSLDVFVDTRLSKLSGKDRRSEDFFIITGRGKRSPTGRSKLKPAIVARLRKRGVRFFEMNPGLLKIKLHKDLAMSTDL